MASTAAPNSGGPTAAPKLNRPSTEPYGAPTAGTPFIAEHLASLKGLSPRQAADTLSMRKALEAAMAKLDNPAASSN